MTFLTNLEYFITQGGFFAEYLRESLSLFREFVSLMIDRDRYGPFSCLYLEISVCFCPSLFLVREASSEHVSLHGDRKTIAVQGRENSLQISISGQYSVASRKKIFCGKFRRESVDSDRVRKTYL